MLKNIFYHFSLFWLCFRLALQILIFSLKLAFSRFTEEKNTKPFLMIIVLFLLITNILIFQNKNRVKIIYEKSSNKNIALENIDIFAMTSEETEEKINYYLKLKDCGIKNRNLYLNLSVLYQEQENNELARYYLEQAQKIDPNYEFSIE